MAPKKKFRSIATVSGSLLAAGLLLTGCSGAGSNMDGAYIDAEDYYEAAVINGDQITVYSTDATPETLKAMSDGNFDKLSEDMICAKGALVKKDDAYIAQWEDYECDGNGSLASPIKQSEVIRTEDTLLLDSKFAKEFYAMDSDIAKSLIAKRDAKIAESGQQ